MITKKQTNEQEKKRRNDKEDKEDGRTKTSTERKESGEKEHMS